MVYSGQDVGIATAGIYINQEIAPNIAKIIQASGPSSLEYFKWDSFHASEVIVKHRASQIPSVFTVVSSVIPGALVIVAAIVAIWADYGGFRSQFHALEVSFLAMDLILYLPVLVIVYVKVFALYKEIS
jgi:hypothetical protein